VGVEDGGGDCDDQDAKINPQASEICNGLDDDCDGLVDDEDTDVQDQSTWYEDSDNDGYGDPSKPWQQCEAPESENGSSWVDNGMDIDDTNHSDYLDTEDRFVGYSSVQVDGGEGIYGMTVLCRYRWPESRICLDTEIARDAPEDPANGGNAAWVLFTVADIYSDDEGDPVYVNALGIQTSDMPNCEGDFSSSASYKTGLTYGSGEDFGFSDCDHERLIACCGPEEQTG